MFIEEAGSREPGETGRGSKLEEEEEDPRPSGRVTSRAR